MAPGSNYGGRVGGIQPFTDASLNASLTLCGLTRIHERVLFTLIQSLLLEGLAPQGNIVDAGANDGDEACLLAVMGRPHRVVHALEPLHQNDRAAGGAGSCSVKAFGVGRGLMVSACIALNAAGSPVTFDIKFSSSNNEAANDEVSSKILRRRRLAGNTTQPCDQRR